VDIACDFSQSASFVEIAHKMRTAMDDLEARLSQLTMAPYIVKGWY
jgi:hypothetical protein